MPRRSAASLAVVAPITDARPSPPEGLTEEQSKEWLAVTRRLPHDYFPRECHRLLEAYVRHASAFRILSESVDAFRPEWMADPEGLLRYDKLLAMREREGRALSSLATRLRISPQSRWSHAKAQAASTKLPAQGMPPWERFA
jgi:hypothetical protein